MLLVRRRVLCLEPVTHRFRASQTRDLLEFQLDAKTHFLHLPVLQRAFSGGGGLSVSSRRHHQHFSAQQPKAFCRCKFGNFCLHVPPCDGCCHGWFWHFVPNKSNHYCGSVKVLRRGSHAAPTAAFDAFRWERGLGCFSYVGRQRKEVEKS
uniref:Uncharacterized protein n=1 Tax=Rhizophora mucronata TaxID=61149 RepID=A0A2P2KCY9_RHIMU